MKNSLLNKRDLLAYFFVASTGALINLIVSSVSQDWFSISFKQSVIAGYLAASLVGFFLTRMFAFDTKNSTKSKREMIKFTMVACLSFLITVYGSDVLFKSSSSIFGIYNFIIPNSVKTVNINKLLSQVLAMGFSFLSNYILHKKFTFNDTGFYSRLKWLLFRKN